MNDYNVLLIFVPQVNPRIDFIFQLIFNDILGIKIQFTDNDLIYQAHPGAKIAYGIQCGLNSKLFFGAANLLFETNIYAQNIKVTTWDDMWIFYQVNEGLLPFDPFAASFYLLSRYEEYLNFVPDKHDRFCANESLAYENGFLHQPLVNIWAKYIAGILQKEFPDLILYESKYKCITSLDIDNAYAFKNKGLLRPLIGGVNNLIKFNWSELWLRFLVLTGKIKDPFDNYNEFLNIHRKYNIDRIFFFLMGDYAKYDKNISYHNIAFQNLVRSVAREQEIGLHPSYGAGVAHKKIVKEKKRIEGIVSREITKSRQHYIKLRFPDTYRALIKAGITEDYSMGYSTHSGFRASICTPFMYYDLLEERQTELKIFPFVIMDSTMRLYENILPEDVITHVKPFYDIVKKVGGHFILVFHNESLGNYREWKGWGNVYKDILELVHR